MYRTLYHTLPVSSWKRGNTLKCELTLFSKIVGIQGSLQSYMYIKNRERVSGESAIGQTSWQQNFSWTQERTDLMITAGVNPGSMTVQSERLSAHTLLYHRILATYPGEAALATINT